MQYVENKFQEIADYNPQTGTFHKDGKPAGRLSKAGHILIRLAFRSEKAENLVWLNHGGTLNLAQEELYHLDGNKLNNKIQNLAIRPKVKVTKTQAPKLGTAAERKAATKFVYKKLPKPKNYESYEDFVAAVGERPSIQHRFSFKTGMWVAGHGFISKFGKSLSEKIREKAHAEGVSLSTARRRLLGIERVSKALKPIEPKTLLAALMPTQSEKT